MAISFDNRKSHALIHTFTNGRHGRRGRHVRDS